MKIKLLSIIFTLIFCAFSSTLSFSYGINGMSPSAQLTKSPVLTKPVKDTRCQPITYGDCASPGPGCWNPDTGLCCTGCQGQ